MSEQVFSEGYTSAYDTLYQDKDYEAECDFLEQVFADYAQPSIHTILDLGCGTGEHALLLAERGYTVTGVDFSESMLLEARQKATAQWTDCDFIQDDICVLDLDRAYDAVIAMFAVVSYQTTNESLEDTFLTARQHLEPGGLFVFDCWYGPAVLAQRPTSQYKDVEHGTERVLRYASSILDISQHTVQVNYKVLRLKDDQVLEETDESHLMRFLFPQEIKHYLNENAFKLLRLCPFMEFDLTPTERDWNVTVIARAI